MLEVETLNEKAHQSFIKDRNLLLSSLPETIRRELPARLIHLQRSCLVKIGQPINHLYFPISGIVSLRSNAIDVALIGYEGIVGSSVAAGNKLSQFEIVVSEPGVAFEVPTEAFFDAIKLDEELRFIALKFEQVLTLQIAQRFLGARLSTQEARLAHHLAMCFDRIEGQQLAVRHSELGDALGIRRAGVTDALHSLEGQGTIKTKRVLVQLKDLSGLRKAANIAYGPAEKEYEKLFGFSYARPV